MPQAKPIKFFAFALFVGLFLLTRLPYLAFDEINPDGVNWHFRSEQFIVGLKTHDWAKTYQHYHPGVTLMWIMGVPIELVKHLSPTYAVYNQYTFETFNYVAKFALVFVQLILSFTMLHLLSRVLGLRKAYFATLLFTFEPFFVGNSRLLHMDVLLTQFLFIGLILAYLQLEKFNVVQGMFAGFFLALAFLTKSIGILGLLFALGVGGVVVFTKYKWKKTAIYIVSIAVSFILTIFIVFPAMWVKPVWVINEIFSEGERIGIRNGHGQVILGEYTRNAGPAFYPLVLAMKASPLLLLGLGLFVLTLKNNSHKRFILFLTLFYVGYLVLMSYPSKKIDRYMIPMYPFLAVLSVLGYFKIYDRLANIKQKTFFVSSKVVLVSAFIIYPLLKFYPYYFLYTSSVFGSSSEANKILAQKPFGIGIHDLKQLIFTKYGAYPRVGFIDTKPMRTIYMNSRIFDIRVNGTSDYDLLVLGVNEDFPEKVDADKFTKDTSMYINGLEYWRIYVKKVD